MATFRTDPAEGTPEGADEANPPAWASFRSDGPTPYLSQPRAQSALRQQLAVMAAGLVTELDRRRASEPTATHELQVLPNRLIARLGGAGLSFSWIAALGAQALSVADGRLLVIQWTGVTTERSGLAALRSAHPVCERVYRPEAVDPEHWQWRLDEGEVLDDADRGGGSPCSTSALVAEWLAASASTQHPVGVRADF